MRSVRHRAFSICACSALAAASVLVAACGDSGGGTTTVIERTVTAPPTTTNQTQNAQTVEVGRGIAGVAVGMSDADVRATLGTPQSTNDEASPFGGTITVLHYAGGLTVSLPAGSDVSAVASTSAQARTPEGVGVGSSEQEVADGVDGAVCETVAGNRSCRVGEAVPGAIVTDFRITGGRVGQVMVARVLD